MIKIIIIINKISVRFVKNISIFFIMRTQHCRYDDGDERSPLHQSNFFNLSEVIRVIVFNTFFFLFSLSPSDPETFRKMFRKLVFVQNP